MLVNWLKRLKLWLWIRVVKLACSTLISSMLLFKSRTKLVKICLSPCMTQYSKTPPKSVLNSSRRPSSEVRWLLLKSPPSPTLSTRWPKSSKTKTMMKSRNYFHTIPWCLKWELSTHTPDSLKTTKNCKTVNKKFRKESKFLNMIYPEKTWLAFKISRRLWTANKSKCSTKRTKRL